MFLANMSMSEAKSEAKMRLILARSCISNLETKKHEINIMYNRTVARPGVSRKEDRYFITQNAAHLQKDERKTAL